MGRKEKAHVSTQTFEKTIDHKLTREDEKAYLQQFLDMSEDMDRIEADRKASNEMHKKRWADKAVDRQRVLSALRMGSEDRKVTVEKEINWKTRKVTLRRMDTKKVIEKRGLLPEEMQMELKAADPTDDVAPAPDVPETQDIRDTVDGDMERLVPEGWFDGDDEPDATLDADQKPPRNGAAA